MEPTRGRAPLSKKSGLTRLKALLHSVRSVLKTEQNGPEATLSSSPKLLTLLGSVTKTGQIDSDAWVEALLPTVVLATQHFKKAAETWLEIRRPYLSPKTFKEYKLNIKTLGAFFGEMRLTEITADQVRAYQRMRQLACGAPSINHECGLLQQMMKHIGRWGEIAHQYQRLPSSKQLRGRALTDEEREQFFKIAKLSKNWDGVRLCALISISTTASPKETFTLRIRDVELEARYINIHSDGLAKNIYRIRRNAMNDECHAACLEALVRARSMGSYEPDHYLFPFRITSSLHDPTKHQTTFRTGWEKIKAKACELGMNVKGLRLEDMRHSAITYLLEDPEVSEETAEAIAGHINPRTKKIYSHVRMEAKRKAMEALLLKKKPSPSQSAGTQADTQQMLATILELLSKVVKTGTK